MGHVSAELPSIVADGLLRDQNVLFHSGSGRIMLLWASAVEAASAARATSVSLEFIMAKEVIGTWARESKSESTELTPHTYAH